MSLYPSDWPPESEKLKDSPAFEDESVFGALGELDPKFELCVDLQQLIADSASTAGVSAEQLFPDLLSEGSLGAFSINDPDHGSSSNLGSGTALQAYSVTSLPTEPTTVQQLLNHTIDYNPEAHPGFVTIEPESMPQVVHIELPSSAVGYAAVPSPAEVESADDGYNTSGVEQQMIVDCAGLGEDSIDLSAALDAGATLLELPIATQETVTSSSSTPTPRPSTSRGRGGKNPLKAPSKKRTVEKNTQEYKERRERNNVAVRKSRDKAKIKQNETNERVKVLTDKNDELQRKLDLLTKELNVLKGLFTNIGASLPSELKNYFIKQEQ